MESSDSSPHYMKATSSSYAKKDNSPRGGEFDDDIMSISSSTGGSAPARKLKGGMKYRTNNKKALINLGNVMSFRRRNKPRRLWSVDSLTESVPHSLKDTSYSRGDKTHSEGRSVSSVDGSGEISSYPSQSNLISKNRVPLKTLSRTSSNRNVRILIKRNSFKNKKSLMNRSRDSEDFYVDRATYSSILKDSKFAEPLELHAETAESERIPAVHICRYHHCSLHGHCQEEHDSGTPPKHFLEKNRQPVKKQKHPIENAGLPGETKRSGGKKTNVQESRMISGPESSFEETKNDNVASSDVKCVSFNEKPNIQPHVDGFSGIQEFDFFELAFGETSFPERNYQDTLDIMRKYEWMPFGLREHCLTCSCNREEQIMSSPRRADVDLPQRQVSASSLGKKCNDDTSQEQLRTSVEDFATSDETSSNDGPKTAVMSDEVTKKGSTSLSVSNSQVSSDTNSEGEGESVVESTDAGHSFASKLMQANDSGSNVSSREGNTLQFSKPRHVSMWHVIHQHMASELATETVSNPLQPSDDENQTDSPDSLVAKESSGSVQEFSETTVGEENTTETQDIEVRKLFAIKLVREAIEKILLPEIQDDQSVTSESISQQEFIEKRENEGFTQESYEESYADIVEGDTPCNPEDIPAVAKDASSSMMAKIEKITAVKSEKKAPKHWSNLKKWILLQRFIRELEKVRKFSPGKPRILPLNSGPEAEKVNLRPQTVDEKKKGEEWMLDYALRQAIDQLAPTQKRKVALLVKAFETVVPPQEDSPLPLRTSRLNDNTCLSESVSRENGMDEELPSIDPKARLSKDGKFSSIGSENQANSTKLTRKSWNFLDLMGELTSTPKYVAPSTGEPKESESRNGDPSLATQRLITDDSRRLMASEKEAGAKPGNITLKNTSSDSREENEPLNLQSDEKNHIKMWHMIYKHVVSGIADKFGDQLLNGSDEDDESPEVENDDYCHDFVKSNGGTGSNPRKGFSKADALKLVKEAVDEILVTETQDDSSDTQCITSELTDKEISDENLLEPKTPKPKNWIKLKRILLIKKSIRVLEKAREVNRQTHELLTQIPETEPEKVDLEWQMMDERKRAKQWMLDYAVQHIVSKLTPARRRKVYMLVEAFEAVVPLPAI